MRSWQQRICQPSRERGRRMHRDSPDIAGTSVVGRRPHRRARHVSWRRQVLKFGQHPSVESDSRAIPRQVFGGRFIYLVLLLPAAHLTGLSVVVGLAAEGGGGGAGGGDNGRFLLLARGSRTSAATRASPSLASAFAAAMRTGTYSSRRRRSSSASRPPDRRCRPARRPSRGGSAPRAGARSAPARPADRAACRG